MLHGDLTPTVEDHLARLERERDRYRMTLAEIVNEEDDSWAALKAREALGPEGERG